MTPRVPKGGTKGRVTSVIGTPTAITIPIWSVTTRERRGANPWSTPRAGSGTADSASRRASRRIVSTSPYPNGRATSPPRPSTANRSRERGAGGPAGQRGPRPGPGGGGPPPRPAPAGQPGAGRGGGGRGGASGGPAAT